MTQLRLVATTLASVPCLYIACVLLGAPWAYDAITTLVLCLWLAATAVLPVLRATDADFNIYMPLVFRMRWYSEAQRRALYAAAGSLGGAWLGAVVVPLDWDRWWQRYPLPNTFGSLLGLITSLACYTLQSRGSLRASNSRRSYRKMV